MVSFICRALDRVVMELAARNMPSKPCQAEPIDYAQLRQLQSSDLFMNSIPLPGLIVKNERFSFRSEVSSPYSENNLAVGRLHAEEGSRLGKPHIILLHGWNDEYSYLYRFPKWRDEFTRRGLVAVDLELPYHLSRRPRPPSETRDFISGNLVRSLEAVQQSVADIRSLGRWLLAHGASQVGLWGFSLGAWLGGLAACSDRNFAGAVLTTPVADLARAIYDLPFCRPLKSALASSQVPLDLLDLNSKQPHLTRERILLVEGLYDLFAPPVTVEELWQAWGKPDIHRYRHGHITLLFSPAARRRTLDWWQALLPGHGR